MLALRSAIALAALAALTLTTVSLSGPEPTAASHLCVDSGNSPNSSNNRCGMDVMAVDMDPSATPANTATSIGTQEMCARINENGIQDADEDAVDTVTVDVTADNIPSTNTMILYIFDLNYSSANLTVETHDPLFLLNANPSSSILDASEAPPDNNADNIFAVAVTDPGDSAGEFGDGVLSRFTISTEAAAALGNYALNLDNAQHGDLDNDIQYPDQVNFGYIAINGPCGDFDGDGLADAQDACPSLPGVAQNNGCPPPGPPAVGGIAGLLDEAAKSPESARHDSSAPTPLILALAALVTAIAVPLGTVFAYRRIRRP